MTALAIMRVGKLKSFGNLGGSEKHTARLQDTPNADPYKENIRLIGNNNDSSLEEIVKAKIAAFTKHKPRKDAVLCSEIFLSASPEYFRPHDPDKAGEWNDRLMLHFANASKKWLQKNFGEKCVRAELHLDESTPHIHAYIVPINDKTKKLSHKAMFGGDGRQASIKMSKLQDSYASCLAHLGIKRGMKGSKATHTKVKEYYQAVNQEPLSLELERFAPKRWETAQQLFKRIKADPTIQSINHQLADHKRIVELEKRASQRAKASETSRFLLEKRVQQLELENFYWKQQADKLRDLPLEEVAWHLGLDKADKGENRWKGLERVININGSKWYDFTEEKGSSGAIDLVMHVNNFSFRSSVAWLHDQFGEEGIFRATKPLLDKQVNKIIQEEATPNFEPPTWDESKWLYAKDYLVNKRGLDDILIAALHQREWLYADNQQNAVFTMRELPYGLKMQYRNAENTLKGAFLRGTRGENNSFMGYATNSKRREGWFYFYLGGETNAKAQKVILCKSPIEVLSVATIGLMRRGGIPDERTMYMAVDSPKSLPLDFLRKVPVITAAYDNDDAGNSTAQAIKELLPQTTIAQPSSRDWNAELLERLRLQTMHQKKAQKKKNRGLEL
ncbi:MAG: MobV family relaxase [Cyanobacteria bacterium J06632_19]